VDPKPWVTTIRSLLDKYVLKCKKWMLYVFDLFSTENVDVLGINIASVFLILQLLGNTRTSQWLLSKMKVFICKEWYHISLLKWALLFNNVRFGK